MIKPECTCPYGERSLGRLYGVNMGRDVVRLDTDPYCHLHNDHPYTGHGDEPCSYCGGRRVDYIHPDQRPSASELTSLSFHDQQD